MLGTYSMQIIFVGKSEGRDEATWETRPQMGGRKVKRFEGVSTILPAQEIVQWQGILNTVINFMVP
jgi:hypothetical protein